VPMRSFATAAAPGKGPPALNNVPATAAPNGPARSAAATVHPLEAPPAPTGPAAPPGAPALPATVESNPYLRHSP
jgi:hypothetical protein